tara:strand:- start:2500 stop:3549 length:1050 start_codon:yes stop_codon:yes gene_type:complete
MLYDVDQLKILNDNLLNNTFSSALLKDINENCKILNSDFYLDSFNYIPITKKNETFLELFKRDDGNSLNHFYTQDFYKNFSTEKKNFKLISNAMILGSSPSDNYFSNLIYFFPRMFFLHKSKLNLVIHRNLSNKFRNFVKTISQMRDIDVKFTFIDDGFYNFEKSSIPQFFNINKSIKILRYFLSKVLKDVKTPEFRPKIYIRREDSNYRRILNEADLIEKLRKNDFEIINPNHFEILEQMKIFSNAKFIISPLGSNLTNLIFCNEEVKIIEIAPELTSGYEKNISLRYKRIANLLNLKFTQIIADSVNVDKHSEIAKKYINSNFLNNSNYYKNMILKVSEIDNIFNNQ